MPLDLSSLPNAPYKSLTFLDVVSALEGAPQSCENVEGESEGSGRNPDLYAQYAHDAAAKALKQIDSMKSRGYRGQEILSKVNGSWPSFQEPNSRLAQESHESARQERKQKRAQIDTDIVSIHPVNFQAPNRSTLNGNSFHGSADLDSTGPSLPPIEIWDSGPPYDAMKVTMEEGAKAVQNVLRKGWNILIENHPGVVGELAWGRMIEKYKEECTIRQSSKVLESERSLPSNLKELCGRRENADEGIETVKNKWLERRSELSSPHYQNIFAAHVCMYAELEQQKFSHSSQGIFSKTLAYFEAKTSAAELNSNLKDLFTRCKIEEAREKDLDVQKYQVVMEDLDIMEDLDDDEPELHDHSVFDLSDDLP